MKHLVILFSSLLLALSAAAVETKTFAGQKIGKAEAEVYRFFELREKDVIIAYDGKVLASPQEAMDLYMKIKKDQVSKLLVERDNNFIEITKTK